MANKLTKILAENIIYKLGNKLKGSGYMDSQPDNIFIFLKNYICGHILF